MPSCPPSPAPEPSTTRRFGVLLPVGVWVVAAATVAISAAAFGYSPFESSTWSRWDSGHYENIARDGYDLGPCDSPDPNPPEFCGDAGWFPAYPWLMRGLHMLGIPLRAGGVFIAWAFALATIVLLWATFFERRTGPTIVAALVFAAFVPGQIYHYAVFPLSLLAFSTVACLWLLHRQRWVGAGLAGGVAALSYPLGVVLVPVSAVWILIERAVPVRERLRRTAMASGIMAVVLGLLPLVQWLETGRWNAYSLVQEQYYHRLQSPVVATWRYVESLFSGPFELWDAVALQTALVTVAVVLVLVHAAFRAGRGALERVDVLLLLWLLATWGVPLLQENVAWYRGHAALLPLAILVARLPAPLLFALAAATVPVAVLIEKLFLEWAIV